MSHELTRTQLIVAQRKQLDDLFKNIMQHQQPTQAARAAAAAATSDTPSPNHQLASQQAATATAAASEQEKYSAEQENKSTSAKKQTRAPNELHGEEANRSLAFEEAAATSARLALTNRTSASSSSSSFVNPQFDDTTTTNDEESYEDELAAAAATSASPTVDQDDDDDDRADDDRANDEGEPGLRRRASIMASLVPDNKRLAALLAGKGPLSSELKKFAKSSGLSKALAERARRRNKTSAKPATTSKSISSKQSNASHKAHAAAAKAAAAAAAKSMQTRQGLATTMASNFDLPTTSNLSSHMRNNHLKHQLSAMSTGVGTLPQLSSAIQRFISLGKFGLAGGGVTASPQSLLLASGAHLNSSNNQTMTNGGNNGASHQKKQQQSYAHLQDYGDFSLTSASGGSGGDSSSTGVGRYQSVAAADDFDQLPPFELASASALPEQQVPQSDELADEPDELGGHHQQQAPSARLAELMSRWQAQMAAGPSEVSTTHDGGLLSLQAAQQRNKLAASAGGHHSPLLDLPTSGGSVGGGGATNKQQQQQLIPVEIIGLDPSVTNSILYGSIRQQQQQQQHARRPPPPQPLLSATSQQDHYQQLDAHAAPPGGDYAHHTQPSGQSANGGLDIHAPPSEQQIYSTNVVSPLAGRGQRVLDSNLGAQEPPEGSDKQPTAGQQGTKQQSPVLHVHHFHHTSNEPTTASQQVEKTEANQQGDGQQDSASQQVVSGAGATTGGPGLAEPTSGGGQTQEGGAVVATASESENADDAQAPQEGGGDQTSPYDSSARVKSRMRFVTSGSYKSKQRPHMFGPADGRPPRLAANLPHSSYYQNSNTSPTDDESDSPLQHTDESHSNNGQSNNPLLMVSYKPASPAHQLNYQQQQQQQQFYTSSDQEEPGGTSYADGNLNPNFQRPPPPYNEGSESKYPSASSGGTRISAPSNLSQSIHGNSTIQTANLIRSLMSRQQQQQFQIKLAGPNDPGQWSSEDERLLNQFNMANSNNNNHLPQYQRLPLMIASSGPANSSATSRPAAATAANQNNPFWNHYQQFVDNLAMLKQLKAPQQRPPSQLPRLVSSQGEILLGNLTNVELGHPNGLPAALEPTHFSPAQNSTTTNGRYELASASDRFASKLRANSTQQRPRPSTLFTANDNFHVPNTSSSNKSSLDLLLTKQPAVAPVAPSDSPPVQVDPTRQVQSKQTTPVLSHEQVHASSEPTNFIDSTNGLSNLALAFIFVVSLLTFILIAASLIYRRRRGRVRYGGTSLASGRGGGDGGSHTAGGQSQGRLNLTRAKHLMRSSFVGAGRGDSGESIPDTTDQSNVSSLKSINHLGEDTANKSSHQVMGGNNQQHQQNTNTVQQRQLKSALKQPSQQPRQQDLNNNNNNNNNNNHNYINKYICANTGQRQSGPGGKASRFFGFGGDKYQSADESTTAPGDGATSNPDSDIKTLNTRLAKAAAAANYLRGQQQQQQQQPASSKHLMSHKRGVVANPTIQRAGGAKYKNLQPANRQQGPPPPPPPVACLKHAML